MRLPLIVIGCFMTLISVGQTIPQSLRIQIAYQEAGQYLEQAVSTIDAVNTIGSTTTVEYRAGHSVVLLPGFEARTGSTFTATIKPIDGSKEGNAKLRMIASPNPVEQSTMIDYFLPADGNVTIWITDTQGKIVSKLVENENQVSGNHRIEWHPNVISTGIYIAVVRANQQEVFSRLIKK